MIPGRKKRKNVPLVGQPLHAAARKANRYNLKVCLWELKALYGFIAADMDEDTRISTEMTLRNCIMKLERIAEYYRKAQPKIAAITTNQEGEPNA